MMASDTSSLWYKFKKHTPQILQWMGRALAGIFLFSLLFVLLLRWINPPTTAFMMQRSVTAWWNGEEDFDLYQSWTDWEDISPHIKMAAITSEDQNFANHWGIDMGSVQKAIEEYERGQGLRGASTITQQTAKNLFLWPTQSYIRKGIEAYFAVLLELLWSKERILEVYLNVVEFGDGIYGVQVASERYFNTTPARLSKAQSAPALPAPKRYNLAAPSSYMRERQRWVMQYMDLLGNSYYLDKL